MRQEVSEEEAAKISLSIKKKIWQKRKSDQRKVQELSSKLAVTDFLSQILVNKIDDINQARDFLYPKFKNLLPETNHFLDMEKAVQRVIKAIKNQEKFILWGDYDVDGATSTAVFSLYLKDIAVSNFDIYIPDRINEGYGININALQDLRSQGVSLVITHDCGTSAGETISFAANIGLDIIVIDHHLSPNIPKDAVAVINPNRYDENKDYQYLAAVGVTFLFIVSLSSALRNDGYFKNIPLPNLKSYLDLVALGTVCDVVPLKGLNRAFVRFGLEVIKLRSNIGINALCEVSSLTPDDIITPYHLGFILGPRINAGGRVGKANLGAKLLSSKSVAEAKIIAAELSSYNEERKAIEVNILNHALVIAQNNAHNNLILVDNQDWHQGVIGIIASRIKDIFNKPAGVVTWNGNIGKASCRSIKGINLGAKIIEAKKRNLIVEGGGHAMAAAFIVEKEKFQELYNFLNQFSEEELLILKDNNQYYDLDLTSDALFNQDFLAGIEQLEPFGCGNAEPLIKIDNLFVLRANIVSQRHITCLFSSSSILRNRSFSAIALNAVDTDLGEILLSNSSRSFSAILNLKVGNWKNKLQPKLSIFDLII